MAVEIKVPDLGTTVDHLKLIKWLKETGDNVKRGEALCEVETDKANMELESVGEGVLLQKLVPEGTDVQVGSVIAYVGQPEEKDEQKEKT